MAVPELLARAASIELATDTVTYRQNVVLRGLRRLVVSLVPA